MKVKEVATGIKRENEKEGKRKKKKNHEY